MMTTLSRKEQVRLNVVKMRDAYKSLGLTSLQLWLPKESHHRFRGLAVHERVNLGCALPTDAKEVLTYELDLPELLAVKEIVREFAANANPNSPRWDRACKLLKALEEVLKDD